MGLITGSDRLNDDDADFVQPVEPPHLRRSSAVCSRRKLFVWW